MSEAIIELRHVTKMFGSVRALRDISLEIRSGEVCCLLGDNGAGKSTLIKILSGYHQPTTGEYRFEGRPIQLFSPGDALSHGIATVYQDLALVPLMSIWRNFFLGSEPQKGAWPFKRYDIAFARHTVREEMSKMGIDIRDPDQNVGTLSGGERQSLAIARAVYFGAKVLILDEPTAALGVKQAGTVLRYIVQAKARGLAVIFITHNPHHAYVVGDRFVVLKRGRVSGRWHRDEVERDVLIQAMSGAEELDMLRHELEGVVPGNPAADSPAAENVKAGA